MSKPTPAQKAQNAAIERDETISVLSSGTILSQKLGKKLQSLDTVETNKTKHKEQDKPSDSKKVNKHGKKYSNAKKIVESVEFPATIEKALEVIKKAAYGGFVETLELKLNVKEIGLKGEIKMPYSTGRKVRVAVADDNVIAALEKGQITFDVLLASPAFMPKLVKFAKLLGPKGLMPNPKTGTISQDPQSLLSNFSADTIRFKTESKAPIIHLVVGKLNDQLDNLIANVQAAVRTVGVQNINTAYIKASMSPAVAIKFSFE